MEGGSGLHEQLFFNNTQCSFMPQSPVRFPAVADTGVTEPPARSMLGGWSPAAVRGLAVVGLWTTVASWALIKLCALLTPLRVDLETEVNGLDLSAHGERAYEMNS
jgi:ammonia channel protein AmtB